jgi:hypothetical protein
MEPNELELPNAAAPDRSPTSLSRSPSMDCERSKPPLPVPLPPLLLDDEKKDDDDVLDCKCVEGGGCDEDAPYCAKYGDWDCDCDDS